MPKETIQFPSVDGTIATETSVRWTREEQGGHVQISIQRYPAGAVEFQDHGGKAVRTVPSAPASKPCVNGCRCGTGMCNGKTVGCRHCPSEDRVMSAIIGNSHILQNVFEGVQGSNWRPFVDSAGNEGADHAHTLSKDGADTCTVCGVPLFAKAADPVVQSGSGYISSGTVGEESDAMPPIQQRADVDPTKTFGSTGPFGTVGPLAGVTVESTLRTALPGAYVLPPFDSDLAATEPDGSLMVWSDPLDRASINKLIKVLRRARDQAYGQDE